MSLGILNISKDEESTASLGNLFWCSLSPSTYLRFSSSLHHLYCPLLDSIWCPPGPPRPLSARLFLATLPVVCAGAGGYSSPGPGFCFVKVRSPFFQPLEIPLNSSTTLWWPSHSHSVCSPAGLTVPITQVINGDVYQCSSSIDPWGRWADMECFPTAQAIYFCLSLSPTSLSA